MKNFIIIGFLSTICALPALSQNETRLGIKAGITSANITGSDVGQLSSNGNPNALQGFHVGLFVNSKTKKNFWIKSEMIYIQKGSTLQTKDASGNQQHSKLTSSYIDLYPICPTLHWNGVQILAGPYVSMLLSAAVGDTSSFGAPTLLTSYRQKFDAGFVVGAEYETKWGISIGCRYTKGFVPLYEKPGNLVTNPSVTPTIQNVYNESLSFSIGYSFGGREQAKAAPKKKKP